MLVHCAEKNYNYNYKNILDIFTSKQIKNNYTQIPDLQHEEQKEESFYQPTELFSEQYPPRNQTSKTLLKNINTALTCAYNVGVLHWKKLDLYKSQIPDDIYREIHDKVNCLVIFLNHRMQYVNFKKTPLEIEILETLQKIQQGQTIASIWQYKKLAASFFSICDLITKIIMQPKEENRCSGILRTKFYYTQYKFDFDNETKLNLVSIEELIATDNDFDEILESFNNAILSSAEAAESIVEQKVEDFGKKLSQSEKNEVENFYNKNKIFIVSFEKYCTELESWKIKTKEKETINVKIEEESTTAASDIENMNFRFNEI